MSLELFTVLWLVVGFFGCLWLFFIESGKIRLDSVLSSMWLGLLGPIGVGFVAYFTHGNLILYEKKR